jgi:serine/threonine protein kinase
MISGKMPFDDEIASIMLKKIKIADYIMPVNFSIEVKDLIFRILQVDPNKRIKLSEIKLHPWVREDVPFYIDIMSLNSKVKKYFDFFIENFFLIKIFLLFF